MEGIRDGTPVDDCFHCALLYPPEDDAPCALCGGRMRYEPAQLSDAVAIEAALTDCLKVFLMTESVESLTALLVAMHRYRPEWRDILGAAGVSLDRLRGAYTTLGGSKQRGI